MPTINKPKRNYNAKRQRNDLDRKERQQIYNSQIWRDMRLAYKMAHPLCEVCQMLAELDTDEYGCNVALTNDIHHLVSFTRYKGNERDAIAYDPNNLIATCKQHHYDLHHGDLKGCKTKEEIMERLKSLLTNNQPKINPNGKD